jgi:hypothetical protein
VAGDRTTRVRETMGFLSSAAMTRVHCVSQKKPISLARSGPRILIRNF